MDEREKNAVAGVVFDDTAEITVTELCEACSVEYTLIAELVDEGVLDPVDSRTDEPSFPYTSVRRTRTVLRLQQDLGVNLAGAALAIDLLDRIESLRRQVRSGCGV